MVRGLPGVQASAPPGKRDGRAERAAFRERAKTLSYGVLGACERLPTVDPSRAKAREALAGVASRADERLGLPSVECRDPDRSPRSNRA